MRYERKIVWLPLLILFAAGVQARAAQSIFSAITAATQKGKPAAAPVDPLGRTTPRSSISNFLGACHRGGGARAAQYLDLTRLSASERKDRGPDLARDVCILINRDAQFELHHLSNAAEGMPEDGLEPGKDLLDTFRVGDRTVPLYLERKTRNGIEVWLVSADSVARLPDLQSLTQKTLAEKLLPSPLVTIRLIGTSVWIWIALILIAIVLATLSRMLSRAVLAALKPLAKRHSKSVAAFRLEAFTEPLRLLVAVIVFRIVLNFITPSALMRQYLLYVLSLLFVIGVASVIMRIADVIADRIMSRMNPKERAFSYSAFRVGVRFVKICIFFIAVLFVLHQWGFKIDAILAGLGVGGLAVALAAQKTLENLFGGISIISDKPVLVGDFCLFESQGGVDVGTVEDIGLRSTRIRTLDRTVVTIPNANFSMMTLVNFGKRDMMWFHPTLHLRRDTKPAQIRAMMAAIEKILRDHPKVDPTGVPLRFTKILDQSFQLEIFSYVMTPDYDEFLRVQTELLLKFLEAAEELNVGFAVPLREVAAPKPGPGDEADSFFAHLESGENGSTKEEHRARQQR